LLEGEHDVTCLEDPQEALRELLRDTGYDLVLCDLMMPKLSGMDIFQVLRFNRPGYEAKMVFMTGGAFTVAARNFLTQVPTQHIEKPFNLRVLQRLLKRFIRRSP
jgi:CheY-like chemotaxis protein